jgi:hypothetical protein
VFTDTPEWIATGPSIPLCVLAAAGAYRAADACYREIRIGRIFPPYRFYVSIIHTIKKKRIHQRPCRHKAQTIPNICMREIANMKKLFSFVLLSAALLFSVSSYALDAAEQRYIDMLTNGGPVSIRDAAKSIYNTGEKNQTVLDALAEVLLENYAKTDRDNVDAMSWACKALGGSGNARYHDTLQEVAEKGGHRKLQKYASQSLDQLGDAKAEQYKKGMVSLASLKHNSSGKAEKASAPAAAKNGAPQPLTVVKEGMSMQEVYDLVGQPTATTTHQTGKAWIPFNFKGSDNVRTIALFKGQGRVVFSNESNFSGNWRVIEVQLNKDESGYP